MESFAFQINWEGDLQKSILEGVDNYDKAIGTLGMLLDLDSGTLSVYQNGRRVGTLKNGQASIVGLLLLKKGVEFH